MDTGCSHFTGIAECIIYDINDTPRIAGNFQVQIFED